VGRPPSGCSPEAADLPLDEPPTWDHSRRPAASVGPRCGAQNMDAANDLQNGVPERSLARRRPHGACETWQGGRVTGRPRGEHPSRDELVQAALRCFLRDGYEATTVKQVAEEAGTSVGQLYLTFANKYAMFVAVHAYGNQRLREEYLSPRIGEDMAPWDRVMALVESYMRFWLDHRELASLMALTSLDPAEVQDDPLVQEMYAGQKAQMDLVVSVVGELTSGAGSDLDPGHVVRWCWAAVYGLAATNVRLPHLALDDDELEKIVSVGLRLARAGINDSMRDRPPLNG
jgi:AcrR family transcriptional regulator